MIWYLFNNLHLQCHDSDGHRISYQVLMLLNFLAPKCTGRWIYRTGKERDQYYPQSNGWGICRIGSYTFCTPFPSMSTTYSFGLRLWARSTKRCTWVDSSKVWGTSTGIKWSKWTNSRWRCPSSRFSWRVHRQTPTSFLQVSNRSCSRDKR